MAIEDRLGGLEVLTARQAAARLGVKVETIYAYVSRGVLERSPGPDGRSSVFEARAVERLASGRGARSRTGGISVVLGTALTLIEEERVSYRGLDVAELARRASFEEVAEWLWLGERSPLGGAEDPPPALQPGWRAPEQATKVARGAQHGMPEGTAPADCLRAIASAIGPTDPMRFDLEPDAVVASARRLISALLEGLPERVEFGDVSQLELEGRGPVTDGIASRLWQRLSCEAGGAGAVAALNGALVLIADHGLAASTLAVRVAASVRADPYSVVAAGLSTVSGRLHGAASAPVHRLLEEVERPSRAVAVVGRALQREKRIPGFGHLIYGGWDPRARALFDALRGSGLPPGRLEVVECVLDLLIERVPVKPNIDFALGSLTYAAGMEEGAGEVIFSIGRCAGWIAHALEEYREPALRFRPRAHYVGPPASGAGPDRRR